MGLYIDSSMKTFLFPGISEIYAVTCGNCCIYTPIYIVNEIVAVKKKGTVPVDVIASELYLITPCIAHIEIAFRKKK